MTESSDKTFPFFMAGQVHVAPATLEAVLNPGAPTCRAGETEPCMYVNVLRYVAAPMDVYKAADEGEPTPHNLWLATECEWRPEVRNFPNTVGLVRHLFAEMAGERLGAVMVLRLPPGQSVKRHADSGRYTDYYERLYVPLLCDPGNTFRVGSREFYCAPGEIWTGDFTIAHSAHNGSKRDRYVLTCDFKQG